MKPLYIPPRLWHAKGLGLLGRVLLAEIAEERDEAGFAERLGVKDVHIERTLGTLREMKLVVSVNGGHRLTELGAEFWRPDYAPFEGEPAEEEPSGGEGSTVGPTTTTWLDRNHAKRDKDPPPALQGARGGIAGAIVTEIQGGYTLPDDLFPRLPPEVILATARGEPCFPISEGKKPLVKWAAYQERTPTPDEFRRWLARFRRIWGWGRVTGRVSNLIVLDDDGGGWLEKWGLSPHVATRRGGYHWLGEYPGWRVATLNCKTSVVLGETFPRMDIRGDGGYSVICNGAGEYEWLREPVADPLDFLPSHVRRFFGLETAPKPAPKEERPAGLLLRESADRTDADYLVRRALDVARSRGRNTGAVWFASQMRDAGYTEAETERAGQDYLRRVPDTDTRGEVEPYTEAELQSTIRWAFQQQRREPWPRKEGGR